MKKQNAAIILGTALLLTSCSKPTTTFQPTESISTEVATEQPISSSESTEFWSVLEHLPEFEPELRSADDILWVNGIPLSENPLTYDKKNRPQVHDVSRGLGRGYCGRKEMIKKFA